MRVSCYIVIYGQNGGIALAEMKNRMAAPEAIREALGTGEYQRVLEIGENAAKGRFVKSEWEIIHRFCAYAAFVLAGGLNCTDKEMMERAQQEAQAAMSYAVGSNTVPDDNYCSTLALSSHIIFALGKDEEAFRFVAKSRGIYPDSCRLASAEAALYIQAGRYEEGVEAALQAIELAKEEEMPKTEAETHYYLGLAYKGLGKKAEAREHFQKAADLMEAAAVTEGLSAAMEKCIAMAREEVKNLT